MGSLYMQTFVVDGYKLSYAVYLWKVTTLFTSNIICIPFHSTFTVYIFCKGEQTWSFTHYTKPIHHWIFLLVLCISSMPSCGGMTSFRYVICHIEEQAQASPLSAAVIICVTYTVMEKNLDMYKDGDVSLWHTVAAKNSMPTSQPEIIHRTDKC